jgi:hypothetical protein
MRPHFSELHQMISVSRIPELAIFKRLVWECFQVHSDLFNLDCFHVLVIRLYLIRLEQVYSRHNSADNTSQTEL